MYIDYGAVCEIAVWILQTVLYPCEKVFHVITLP